ncbi:hypothetical protein NFI96_007344 [Prochilodus magdalenae]|nr:hypothetical protein NFI96_007344 [Prochilodus magdalenae]
MTAHNLKLSPSKTEVLFIPSTTGPHHDSTMSIGNSLITPTEDARSLGVILDGQLSFSAHIANMTQSCRFLLYNIQKIRPFLSQEATQLLVQSLVISRLSYCNSLLAGLPLWAIRPLQLVQNAAARLIFNLPKFTHVTPLLRSLHWLSVAARIRFKTLMLAYKAKNGPVPPYLMAMKKRAFKTGDKEELKRVQTELKIRIKEAKEEYRTKLETKLENNNTRDVWRGLKDITGFNLSSSGAVTDGSYERVSELNQFFLRFDNDSPTTPLSSAGSPVVLNLNTSPEQQPPPFTAHTSSIPSIYTSSDSNAHFTTPAQDQSSSSEPTFTADQVKKELKKLKQGKAAGPDGIQPKVLKLCGEQLCGILQHIFNLSCSQARVPVRWKTSCVVPVPKKKHPVELNDYQPVALTSHLMKTLERLMLGHMKPLVRAAMYPLQFAYQDAIGVDGAVIYLMDKVHFHLYTAGSAVRIIF